MNPMPVEPAVVHIRRTFSAPPARVYRAWLEPDVMVRWFAPASFTTARAEVDERVGGHYRVWQEDAGAAEVGGFESELRELVPNEKIVLLWRFVGPTRIADEALDSLLTITLSEAPDGGTELTLVHERLEALDAAMPGMAAHAVVGWGQALDKLAAALAR
jgi:uncharacterized protein YndB with AHSA1/START domain